MIMKIIPSSLVAICAIPSAADAALRGSETNTAAANTSSELINVDDADASSHRKLPFTNGVWSWTYEGYTYTTSGTYEDRFCYYYQSDNRPNGLLYDSMLECCSANFEDQTSGECISRLPNAPSAQPSIALGGLAGKYAAIHKDGYGDGYCSNLKADIANVPEGQLYETEYECCSTVFPGEQYCLDQIDPTDPSYNQPSGQPSIAEGGLPGQYVAVFTNGFDDGYCSNLKADVFGTPDAQIYDSMMECCSDNFSEQTTGKCISMLPGDLQPSAQPSIALGGLPGQYVAVHVNGFDDGYCSNFKADVANAASDERIYETEYECCVAEFVEQTNGYCLSQIDPNDPTFNQPSGQPSISEGGLPGQYVAVFTNGFDDGYCSNLKADVIGTPEAQIYDSMMECCSANFAEQVAEKCISMLPGDLQPSAQPSIALGGLPGQYVAVHVNGFDDGYCSNLKADVANAASDERIYDTEYECCVAEFVEQTNGYCLSQIDPNDPTFNQPSGQPSIADGGLPGQYVAVFTNGFDDGYCSNLKADVIGTPEAQIYVSGMECCSANFPDQIAEKCISMLSGDLQPSAQPSISEGGLSGQYVAVFTNGFDDGYCSNLKADVIGTPEAQIYVSGMECCSANFADQIAEKCISMLSGDLQPSAQPSIADGGLPGQYVAMFENGFDDGYCSNLKADVFGTPDAQIYDSMMECCSDNFSEQTTGKCISMLPDGLQPSAQPSIALGGLPGQYVAVHVNGFDDGYCSNLKADVANAASDERIYETEYECCDAEFPDQELGNCISLIAYADTTFNQPSGQPTLVEEGLPGQYVAVFTNGFDDGYCSNLKADVIGTPDAQIYDSMMECCSANFADQIAEKCISMLSGDLQPSAQPSISEGGLPGQYVAVFTNGFDDGYCSNLKADVIGTPDAQIYDSGMECCSANFADQIAEKCISMLSGDLQPSAQPSIADGGLPGQYVAVYEGGFEDNYCSNLKEYVIGTPEAQIYDSMLECCKAKFADQESGKCISMLPGDLQPSGAPSFDNNGLGGLDVWVPKWTNSYEDGYCSNKKEDLNNAWNDPFDNAFECCTFWFGIQTSETCLSKIPDFEQPSAQPSISEGGLPGQYVPIFANGYDAGYCSNKKEDVIGTSEAFIFDSEFECCQTYFADQESGYCFSQIDDPNFNQPSAQPSISDGGLPGQYVAIFANGYEDGYCSNLKADVIGTPEGQIFDSAFECCQTFFLGQKSGTCLSMIPDFVQPSSQPSISEGGLPGQYVAVYEGGYEDNYCSNLKEYVIGTPEAQIYDSMLECCTANFADQTTGKCMSMLPGDLQPSGAPSFDNNGLGGLDVWVPVWPLTNSYESGYCSNKKADVYKPNSISQPMDSQFECCVKWFGQQTSGTCIAGLPDEMQPSSQPTITGGGLPDAKFFPIWYTNTGIEARYCDNDHNSLQPWQLANYDSMGFDTQAECCEAWFDEEGTACTRRQPTFGTLAPTPAANCGYYPLYSTYETGTCVNDCNQPPSYEGFSNLFFSNDKAGGIECCDYWFPDNGLTEEQIGNGRFTYCIQQLIANDPTTYAGFTEPPTMAPV